jgi:hypothetical protein
MGVFGRWWMNTTITPHTKVCTLVYTYFVTGASTTIELKEGCCYNCERQRQGRTEVPPAPAEVLNNQNGSSSSSTVKEHHAKEIEDTVSRDLMEWRSSAWRRDYRGTFFGKQAIMTEKILQAIAKNSAIMNHKDDFRNVNPAWTLASRYGDEVLLVIGSARSKVHDKYHAEQLERDRRMEEGRRQKQQEEEERRLERDRLSETRRQEAILKKKMKDRNEKKRKYREWEERVAAGNRLGRPPKRPTPSPEPNL